MVLMKLARINGRCAELASSTYFRVCKSQLPRQSRSFCGEHFPNPARQRK